jgi:hypothetical protein
MVDPYQIGGGVAAGAIAAKALQSAAEEGGKAAGGLVSRAFGIAADEIGIALGRFTAFRVGNVERIAEIADRKAKGREGVIAPRLAHSVLEDGSFCDDELMAEYLGGVLAGGRTPSGRDDRAVTWSKLITSMSVLQIRAHFLLYREWAIALQGRTDLDLGRPQNEPFQMYCDFDSFYGILNQAVPDIHPNDLVVHVLSGLARLDLIHGEYAAGNVLKAFPGVNLPFETVCRVYPTMAGMELYGWACGLPGVHPNSFVTTPELTQVDVEILRPSVVLQNLPRRDPPQD